MNPKYECLTIDPQGSHGIHTKLRKCKKAVPRNSLDFLEPDFPPQNAAVSRAPIMVATVASGTFQNNSILNDSVSDSFNKYPGRKVSKF